MTKKTANELVNALRNEEFDYWVSEHANELEKDDLITILSECANYCGGDAIADSLAEIYEVGIYEIRRTC